MIARAEESAGSTPHRRCRWSGSLPSTPAPSSFRKAYSPCSTVVPIISLSFTVRFPQSVRFSSCVTIPLIGPIDCMTSRNLFACNPTAFTRCPAKSTVPINSIWSWNPSNPTPSTPGRLLPLSPRTAQEGSLLCD